MELKTVTTFQQSELFLAGIQLLLVINRFLPSNIVLIGVIQTIETSWIKGTKEGQITSNISLNFSTLSIDSGNIINMDKQRSFPKYQLFRCPKGV